MSKLSFAQLDVEVEKAFEAGILSNKPHETAQIVEALVVASGWTLDEYLERFCRFEDEP
jgi:hypothetical protein